MNVQSERLFIIGNRNLFVTRVRDDGSNVEMATSVRDALFLAESEAISLLNKITQAKPSLISSLRISHIGPKLAVSDASKLNSSIRSAVTFVGSSHLEELSSLKALQGAWESIDNKLWLFDKGLRGLIIHLTRLNINAEKFPSFWEDICHKNTLCFFAILRGVSLNLVTKNQISEAMENKTKHINLNKLIPAILNRVDSFAPSIRIDERKRSDRFVFSDGTNCSNQGCNAPAVNNQCWFHVSSPFQVI